MTCDAPPVRPPGPCLPAAAGAWRWPHCTLRFTRCTASGCTRRHVFSAGRGACVAAGVRRVVQSQEGGRAWQRRQVCFACEKKGGGAVGCTCGCCGAARAQRMYSVGSGVRSRHAACSSLCGNGWRGGLARHAGSAQLPAAVKRIVVSGGRWLCMCRQRRVLSQVRCYWCVPPGLHRRLVSWRVTRKKQLAGAALYVWGRRRRRSARRPAAPAV